MGGRRSRSRVNWTPPQSPEKIWGCIRPHPPYNAPPAPPHGYPLSQMWPPHHGDQGSRPPPLSLMPLLW